MAATDRATVADIDAARKKIVEMLLTQCEYGQQTVTLANPAHAACGQFIGEDAKNVTQRGLHGTAAAISVLADVFQVNAKASDLLPRLIKYTAERGVTEKVGRPDAGQSYVDNDNDNVIKMSELLLALAGVPSTAVVNTDAQRRHLTKSLKDSRIEDKGWPYFRSDPSNGPQLLPTAHAVMALDAVNEDVTGPVRYMLGEISEAKAGSALGSGADVTIRTLALYVLTFPRNANQRPLIKGQLQDELFDSLWQRLEPLLRTESIEQNVEYWRQGKTCYVRVPWQLYLLALAARIRIRRFAGKGAQARMCDILSSLAEGQFRYPHSGKMISSRANAIAYETLGHVRNEMERSKVFGAYVWFDRVRSWGGWRVSAFIIATAAVGVAFWTWVSGEGTKQLIDLAPNFVSSAIIYILLWGRKR